VSSCVFSVELLFRALLSYVPVVFLNCDDVNGKGFHTNYIKVEQLRLHSKGGYQLVLFLNKNREKYLEIEFKAKSFAKFSVLAFGYCIQFCGFYIFF